MKHKRFSDKQIIGVLNEHGAGARVDEVCRRPRAIPPFRDRWQFA